MKKIIVILALFMFFKPVLPFLEYAVFYDYIKNELCENKDKPKLKCNGKCHLAKEMAKASDTPEKGNDKRQILAETSVVFFQELPESCIQKTFFRTTKSKISSDCSLRAYGLKADSVFRPPIA